MKTSQRKAIEKKCSVKIRVLRRCEQLLCEMELEHQRGQEWVFLDEGNCWAVGALKKLEMIEVIFIDGSHRGRIK